MRPEMFLVGEGIAHSLSPAMWNHYFESVGISVTYTRRDVGSDGLDAVLAEIQGGAVLAANVTMPHKAWAAAVADDLSDSASRTGAANLLVPGDRLRATNTDVIGARMLLERRAPYRTVLVLGAGGTAAALLDATQGLAEHVLITNRTRSRAEELASRVGPGFAGVTVIDWDQRDDVASNADLVLSTVPVPDEVTVDPSRLRSHVCVYDAVYRSHPTEFQQALLDRGVSVTDGLAHLAAQAIAMFDELTLEARPELLLEGIRMATGREVSAWGEPIS